MAVQPVSNKQKFREYCRVNPLPLFLQPWWLDAVSQCHWDVVLDIRDGVVFGGWIYSLRKRMTFQYISNAQLSPYQGIFYNYPADLKRVHRISFEHRVYKRLFPKIPKVRYFNQKLHPSITNHLPFTRSNFSTTIRYTYVLKELGNTEKLWENLYSRTRRAIRKARNKGLVICHDTNDPQIIFQLHEKSMQRKSEKTQFKFELLERIDKELIARGARKILLAKDGTGKIHGGIYIAWDHDTAYYLLGGVDSPIHDSATSKFLLWEAILALSDKVEFFDFEGSMNPPVERIFRSFGADQQPYFQIRKLRFPFSIMNLWKQ